MHALLKGILRIAEEWSGIKLNPTAVYGIRRYLRGAWMGAHIDSFGKSTHRVFRKHFYILSILSRDPHHQCHNQRLPEGRRGLAFGHFRPRRESPQNLPQAGRDGALRKLEVVENNNNLF